MATILEQVSQSQKNIHLSVEFNELDKLREYLTEVGFDVQGIRGGEWLQQLSLELPQTEQQWGLISISAKGIRVAIGLPLDAQSQHYQNTFNAIFK